MKQTIYIIPHYLFEGPLLIGWLILGLAIFGYLFWRHGAKSSQSWSFLPVFLIVAAVIYFVLPKLEDLGINPADPMGPLITEGLKIRGYGTFLLAGMLAGVGLTLVRCRQVGLDPDRLLTLTFWMIVMGIVGARLYYIIQKRDEFIGLETSQLIGKLTDMTKGGLVVYGSFFGAMLAAAVFFWWTKMPFRKTADVLAPGMMLGLAVGRIGCLMNGCCYGGVCEPGFAGLRFPATAPPYAQQLSDGTLLGITAIKSDQENETYPLTVSSVQPNSIADGLGIESGDQLLIQVPDSNVMRAVKRDRVRFEGAVATVYSPRFSSKAIPIEDLPDRSLKTHPTQIYSSINAALLCAVLWFYFPFRRHDGEIFALMIALYPIGRFLLEVIRRDEMGVLGTELTSAQWISVAAFGVGIALFVYYRQYPGTGNPAGGESDLTATAAT